MLEVRDLEVAYGRIRAVQGVSLDVEEGEIVALIGANGAGKSSTMHAICGIEPPRAGEIRFLGQSIAGLPSHVIVRRGITCVPEGRMILAGLTIAENLRLGAYSATGGRAFGSELGRVLELFPGLRERLDVRASVLSGGEAQMLALARGLMARPRLLLLDEPSLGLSPLAMREVFDLIRSLPDLGATVLLVEQNVRQALAIADRGYVLEGGGVILQGTGKELREHKLLIDAYMGLAAKETV